MTNEEAIKRLIDQECRFCNDIPSNCEVIDCETKVAIEALEKQIPKKPIKHIMVGNIGVSGNWCPACEWGVHKKYDSVVGNNCPHCGQAIDWSDSNDTQQR